MQLALTRKKNRQLRDGELNGKDSFQEGWLCVLARARGEVEEKEGEKVKGKGSRELLA